MSSARSSPPCFDYYADDWKSVTLRCEHCGWTGTFMEGGLELRRELAECHCPRCSGGENHEVLATVLYPTLEEAAARGDLGSVEERAHIQAAVSFRDRFAALKLKNPHLLPAIEDASFVLHWDVIGQEPDCETVIRHGDRIIAREPAVFEGVHRYRRVAELLRRRYGKALQDLIPTEASRLYLWGDDLSAPEKVEATRREIFRGETLSWFERMGIF